MLGGMSADESWRAPAGSPRDRPQLVCAACSAALGRGGYRFRGRSEAVVLKCAGCAVRHGPIVRNAIKTALVVGTVLTAINQGDVLLRGALSGVVLAKMLLTYIVPYLVSTTGALSVSRVQGDV
jgi:hypothetical protein